MQKYILHRFLHGLGGVLFLAILIFAMTRGTGSPVDLMVPDDAPPEYEVYLTEKLGLDQPWYVQFYRYMIDLATLDFGESYQLKEPVIKIFAEKFSNSIRLIAISFIIALMIGLPLGVIAAVNRGSWIDRICGAIAVAGFAVPSFWLGIVAIFIFAVWLGILPVARMGGPSHYILPALTLGTSMSAGVMRLIRSSMLEALDSEYVKLARIKGVSERKVIWHHCLRNSLLSMFSFLGTYFAVLIGGSIVVETVFAWPGSGRLLYQGIMWRDYPLVQSVIIMKGALIIMVNLVIDVLYAYLDPRIRY